jgi:hypothetical protein
MIDDDGSQADDTAQLPATDVADDTGSPQETDGTEAKAEEAKVESEGDKVKHVPWFQKRIDELTREKWEARRSAEAATALAENLRSQRPEDQQNQPPADFEAMVNRRAAELREVESFNEACNTTYRKGKDTIPDFDEAVQGYQLLGGLDGKRDFLEAVNTLPNGSEIFYHLGKNLDEGAHVLSLPPVKMALELTKLSQKLSKAPAISKAPSPIKPLGGLANHDGDPMNLSTKDWIKWRDKQEAENN